MLYMSCYNNNNTDVYKYVNGYLVLEEDTSLFCRI